MLLEPRLDGLGERDDGIEVFVVRLGLGNARNEQSLVVVGEPRDGGDGAMQGEEVATPAESGARPWGSAFKALSRRSGLAAFSVAW